MIAVRGTSFGNLGPKTMEILQNGHHCLTGRYFAFGKPGLNRRGKAAALFLGIADPQLRRAFGRYVRAVAGDPRLLFRRLHIQTINVEQPFDILPNGEQDHCDGCPNKTLWEDRLVSACVLEEYRRYGTSVLVAVPALKNGEGASWPSRPGEVKSRRDLRTFIGLPGEIDRDHARWVPPLEAEEWKYFQPGKNRAFRSAMPSSSWPSGTAPPPAGSWASSTAVTTRRAERRPPGSPFWECGDDENAARALLERIEVWAGALGMTTVIGPMGFSDQDPQGFLIEGFDEEPTIGSFCNFESVNGFLARAGYAKDMDYVVYRVDLTAGVPEFYRKIAERAMRRGVCRLVEARRRADLKPYIGRVLEADLTTASRSSMGITSWTGRR